MESNFILDILHIIIDNEMCTYLCKKIHNMLPKMSILRNFEPFISNLSLKPPFITVYGLPPDTILLHIDMLKEYPSMPDMTCFMLMTIQHSYYKDKCLVTLWDSSCALIYTATASIKYYLCWLIIIAMVSIWPLSKRNLKSANCIDRIED